MPKNYTVKEVADILGFSTNSIYTFLKEKRLKGVRIGRGRFRIPETELARVLHLSKKSSGESPVAAAQIPPSSASGDDGEVAERSIIRLPKFGELLAPNIFDWFIGLASIIAGFGLFVFNMNFGSSDIASEPFVFPLVRIVLITCGAGIVISSMYFQGRGWHNIFHACLSFLGFLNAYGLGRSGDIEGSLIYGLLAIVLGVSHVVRSGGVVSILSYVSLLAFMFPIVFILAPNDTHVKAFEIAIGFSAQTAGFIGLGISIFLTIGMWMGFRKNRTMFFVTSWGLALCVLFVAVWYAHVQYWSRAFFLVVVGYFTGLLPYWSPLQHGIARRYKYMLHGLFVGIGGCLLVSILVVYLLQQNMWNAREWELTSKLYIAQTRLENAVQSTRSSLLVVASNNDFVKTVSDGNIITLQTYAKVVYESNPNIRRLIFLDESGDGIALYPYGTFDDPNYAYRDYFQQAKVTRQPVISDVFQARGDQEGRYVTVISVPLFDVSNVFVGVIAASLDLNRLGLLLGQIATTERGEYFVVMDTKGVILLHPNVKLIGTQAPLDDPLHKGVAGEKGIMQGAMIEKMHGMIAYIQIPSLRWALSLRVPSRNVFELSSFAIWAVFGMTFFMLFVGLEMFLIIRQRIYQSQGGGTG